MDWRNFPALASICWLLVMTAGATIANPSVLPIMLVLVIMLIILIERHYGTVDWLLA